MKKVIVAMWLIISVLTAFSQQVESQMFYVGTYTKEGGKGILLCELNNKTSEISVIDTFGGIENPAFLKISSNQKYLYAIGEINGGMVAAFEILKNGSLKQINQQPSNGNGPCYVDVSPNGKFVAVANYGSGTMAMYPVNADGSLQSATASLTNVGSGPNKGRQAAPHAHSIQFSPFSNEVFSADLGTDQLDIFTLKENQLIQSGQKFVNMEPGAGPRHFVFHPRGKYIYVINELNSTITQLKKVKANWEKVSSVSTLPTGFNGENYCADIHISADGRFLYGSNRGHNSIAVFAVNPKNGSLKTVGNVSVEGNWPRNFGLSADGKFLLAANQKSGNITVFKINKDTGMPVFTGKECKTASPVCIEFMK